MSCRVYWSLNKGTNFIAAKIPPLCSGQSYSFVWISNLFVCMFEGGLQKRKLGHAPILVFLSPRQTLSSHPRASTSNSTQPTTPILNWLHCKSPLPKYIRIDWVNVGGNAKRFPFPGKNKSLNSYRLKTGDVTVDITTEKNIVVKLMVTKKWHPYWICQMKSYWKWSIT